MQNIYYYIYTTWLLSFGIGFIMLVLYFSNAFSMTGSYGGNPFVEFPELVKNLPKFYRDIRDDLKKRSKKSKYFINIYNLLLFLIRWIIICLISVPLVLLVKIIKS